MRYIAAIALALLLTGCKSEAEKQQEFLNACITTEFTLAQCKILYSIKKSSDDASDNASIAAFVGGMGLGMNTGSRR